MIARYGPEEHVVARRLETGDSFVRALRTGNQEEFVLPGGGQVVLVVTVRPEGVCVVTPPVPETVGYVMAADRVVVRRRRVEEKEA